LNFLFIFKMQKSSLSVAVVETDSTSGELHGVIVTLTDAVTDGRFLRGNEAESESGPLLGLSAALKAQVLIASGESE
jgi:hypothetical protein